MLGTGISGTVYKGHMKKRRNGDLIEMDVAVKVHFKILFEFLKAGNFSLLTTTLTVQSGKILNFYLKANLILEKT